MKLVYICSPYAGDIARNTEMARRYCRAAVNRGVIPYAPHLLMPQWMDDNDPAQRKQALQMGLDMVGRADELWVCGDVISEGMRAEIGFAELCCIPVVKQPYLLRERESDHDIESGIKPEW
jgi:hypothetical protein